MANLNFDYNNRKYGPIAMITKYDSKNKIIFIEFTSDHIYSQNWFKTETIKKLVGELNTDYWVQKIIYKDGKIAIVHTGQHLFFKKNTRIIGDLISKVINFIEEEAKIDLTYNDPVYI